MKKPTIKNWIKYCAGIFAMSGMLLTTSCDSNQTADYENEVEALENEPTTLERENVNEDVAEEAIDTEADDRQTVGGTNDVDYVDGEEGANVEAANNSNVAYPYQPIGNMDEFLRKHTDENMAIRRELTDADNMVTGRMDDPEAGYYETERVDVNVNEGEDLEQYDTDRVESQDNAPIPAADDEGSDVYEPNDTYVEDEAKTFPKAGEYRYSTNRQERLGTDEVDENLDQPDIPEDDKGIDAAGNVLGAAEDNQDSDVYEPNDTYVDEEAKTFPQANEYRYSTGTPERLGADELEEDRAAFNEWDTDGNSVWDLNEFSNRISGIDFYNDWDTDNDGLFSDNEMYEGLFNEWDEDDDGYLTNDEYDTWNTAWGGEYDDEWDAWDVNEDDLLDYNEYSTGLTDAGVFNDWDTDNDGLYSEEEFNEGLFNTWDVNDDGYLGYDEYGYNWWGI